MRRKWSNREPNGQGNITVTFALNKDVLVRFEKLEKEHGYVLSKLQPLYARRQNLEISWTKPRR